MGSSQSVSGDRQSQPGGPTQEASSPRTSISIKRPSKKRRRMTDPTTPPIVDPAEVERRFEETLKKMDLPVNKAKVLRNYDLQKKWKVVCDQAKVSDQGSPVIYLDKLRGFLDPKGTKKKRKLYSSTGVLRHLEISLRTNTIDWVREFLNDTNNGLQTLTAYLQQCQNEGGIDLPPNYNEKHTAKMVNDFGTFSRGGTLSRGTLSRKASSTSRTKLADMKRMLEDDVHISVQCLRALMNNSYGFNAVFNNHEAIDCIARCILHPNLRTKTCVLLLLAAICMVKGGHELVVGAFDRFKKEYNEESRFQTFFSFFRQQYDGEFHVEFMAACMEFINIVVHTVDDKNFRVYLQQEFKILGLEDYLETLKSSESEELQKKIKAYLDNMYDVTQLIEDAQHHDSIQERLEDALMDSSRAKEKLQELESEYMARVGQLNERLTQLLQERENLLDLHQKSDKDLNTLRKELTLKDEQSRREHFRLESKIHELEELQKFFNDGLKSVSSAIESSGDRQVPHPPTPGPPTSPKPKPVTIVPAPPPLPPPPLAPPLPVPAQTGVPRPPPAPPMLGQASTVDSNLMTIKQRVQTKYKLPQLNWNALKPNQLKGTVFYELDDEKILHTLNFDEFEEMFKMGVNVMPNANVQQESRSHASSTASQGHSKQRKTLLDNKRLRNVAITKRKLTMDPADLRKAVNQFDLKALDLENVEILQHILPSAEEVKAFKEYETAKNQLEDLTPEDQFMINISKIERLPQKLQIMSFIGNFSDTVNLLNPSLDTVATASNAAKNSSRFHKVLELVLAFGNYMNSGKRGVVYGFKLQSLDNLIHLKAAGTKNFTLLHYLARIVRANYPDLLSFGQDLKLAEKASTISLESVIVDYKELEKGLDVTKKEAAFRGSECPQVLSRFLNTTDEKCKNLQRNVAATQEAFATCVEFYGESANTTNSVVFFTILNNFAKQFKLADDENVARYKAELKAQGVEVTDDKARGTLKDRQAAVINELTKNANGFRREVSRKREPKEMGLGTLEDIISDITSNPYIDASAPKRQRSFREQRSHMEPVNKSKSYSEIEV